MLLCQFLKIDISECATTFSKAKFPHSFEVRRFLAQGKTDLSDEELREMDPKYYLESSLKKYDGLKF